ncbi:MAG: hypothetical protein ACRD4Q_16465, partial [Candidatus Acidiferrales bacterium]
MSKESELNRREFVKLGAGLVALRGLGPNLLPESDPSESYVNAAPSKTAAPRGWTAQPYSIQHDEVNGVLALSTRYYLVQHDLKKGGAISKISYVHGRASNLLLRPIETSVRFKEEEPANKKGAHMVRNLFADTNDTFPSVSVSKSGKAEVVTIECTLLDKQGKNSGVKAETTYSYRWGYIKVHKKLIFPENPLELCGVSLFSTVVDPSLIRYGYKPSVFEDFSPTIHNLEVNAWGKMRAGTNFDPPYQTRYVPRYLVFANPGIEGIEWFVSDDLSQWDYQMAGQPGTGNAKVSPNNDPVGVAVSVGPLDLAPSFNLPKGGFIRATGTYAFDYYIGMPILEGHANKPWFARSYGPDRGKWVSEEVIKRNAEAGVVTMTLHNDGDTHQDGLYWRDGSWPPYPPDQMKKMAAVIDDCHKNRIKTVPYFSCHELSYSTEEFKQHGEEWGRKPDDQGNLRPNYYYGALMCLKSGWLDYLK